MNLGSSPLNHAIYFLKIFYDYLLDSQFKISKIYSKLFSASCGYTYHRVTTFEVSGIIVSQPYLRGCSFWLTDLSNQDSQLIATLYYSNIFFQGGLSLNTMCHFILLVKWLWVCIKDIFDFAWKTLRLCIKDIFEIMCLTCDVHIILFYRNAETLTLNNLKIRVSS